MLIIFIIMSNINISESVFLSPRMAEARKGEVKKTSERGDNKWTDSMLLPGFNFRKEAVP